MAQIGLNRALPQPGPRVHVPNPPEGRAAEPEEPAVAQHNFRGRDYARFTPQERAIWQAGNWRHESHNGELGWWWVTGGFWYFYPEPIYPYPTNVSEYTYPVPSPISPQYRYHCGDPPGYYPDVTACYDPWQLIPALPPPAVPDAIGPSASADARAGYRIAWDICSACHVVHPSQTQGPVLPQPGPRFEDIADRPGTTAESLEAFIGSTGWDVESRPITMPNQGLSQQSGREVASCIMSLRARK